jgi:hypothetical protein
MNGQQSPPDAATASATAQGAPDWQFVEDGFWSRLQTSYEDEDRMLADEYRKAKAAIQVNLGEIYHERTAAAERLRHLESLCATEEARMEALNTHYEDHRRVRFSMRDATVAQMRLWFATSRGAGAPAAPPTLLDAAPRAIGTPCDHSNTTTAARNRSDQHRYRRPRLTGAL